MMRRNTAAARVTIPAAPADPDTISDSESSTTVPPPKPGRKQTHHSVSQVVEGSSSGTAAGGTEFNRHLHKYGKIPMFRSEGRRRPGLDLNAMVPPDARQPPPQDHPVICAYCNCAFCFCECEVPSLNPRPGRVYPAPSAPITLNLLTPPAVAPLYPNRDPWAPGAVPSPLLVCSNSQHFKATIGMLQHLPGATPPSLVWKCTLCCLRVMPTVVGSEGADSPDLHAIPAPPPEPWTYAGAYWNYVEPGHEDMVKLKLLGDPLNLTLGRH